MACATLCSVPGPIKSVASGADLDANDNWLRILRWARERTGKADPTEQEVEETFQMWKAGERPPMPSAEEIANEARREVEEILRRRRPV